MDTAIDFNEMTEHLSKELLHIYLFYLEIKYPSQLRFDYDIFLKAWVDPDDLDELWELPHPENFTCELTLSGVETADICIGYVRFGRYCGRKVIIEQNACPLMVYWKGDGETQTCRSLHFPLAEPAQRAL